MEKNEFSWVENVPNLPDRTILTVIEGMRRRLSKNIDKNEVLEGMALKQEVFLMEAEKRGLQPENSQN